jgi:hypothetical protein
MDSQLEAILMLSNWLSPSRLLYMNSGGNPGGKAFSDRTSPHPDSADSNFSVTSNAPDSALDSLHSVQYVQRASLNIKLSKKRFEKRLALLKRIGSTSNLRHLNDGKLPRCNNS